MYIVQNFISLHHTSALLKHVNIVFRFDFIPQCRCGHMLYRCRRTLMIVKEVTVPYRLIQTQFGAHACTIEEIGGAALQHFQLLIHATSTHIQIQLELMEIIADRSFIAFGTFCDIHGCANNGNSWPNYASRTESGAYLQTGWRLVGRIIGWTTETKKKKCVI